MNTTSNTRFDIYRFFRAGESNFKQFVKSGFIFAANKTPIISLIFLAAIILGFSAITAKAQSGEDLIPIECEQDPIPNPIFWENYCIGGATRAWNIDAANGAFEHEIEGFASKTSVNVGESITFHVNVKTAGLFKINIYRLGWYQGKGGRLISTMTDLQGRVQSFPVADQTTGLMECDWGQNSYSWAPPAGTVSGFFIAQLTKLTNGDIGKQSYIIFVVRDDNRNPSSEFLFQSAVTTYQAYNDYPGVSTALTPLTPWQEGKSLYKQFSHGPNLPGVPPGPNQSADNQAREVSFNRPYGVQNRIYDSAGHFFELEYNMVRWLEREGYDVTYQTDVDTDAMPGTLAAGKHKALLSVGHDEYWSWQMRENVEQARNRQSSPLNLGFFGGNTSHWQIRFSRSSMTNTSPANTSYRTIVAYKEHIRDYINNPLHGDPVLRDDIPNPPQPPNLANNYLATGYWRDNKKPFITGCSDGQSPDCNCPQGLYAIPNCTKHPEDELVGVMTEISPLIKGDFSFVLDNACPPWIRNGIPGNVRTLRLLVGNEADTFYSGNDYGRTVQTVSSSQITDPETGALGTSNAVYFKLGNQAKVFAIGSLRWSWGLDDFGQNTNYGFPVWKTPRYNVNAVILTRNVLNCLRNAASACGAS